MTVKMSTTSPETFYHKQLRFFQNTEREITFRQCGRVILSSVEVRTGPSVFSAPKSLYGSTALTMTLPFDLETRELVTVNYATGCFPFVVINTKSGNFRIGVQQS